MVQFSTFRTQCRQTEATLKVLFLHGTFNVVTSIGATTQVTNDARTDLRKQLVIDILFGIRRQTLLHFLDRHNRHFCRCRSRNTFFFQLLRMVRDFNVL
ncbi:Uncharacterised protein [Shigella sonnei]|nr:Uncharacterised protein [Shigella sonnei]